MKQREILNVLSPDFVREGQENYIESKKEEIVNFIKDYLVSSKMEGFVVGVSGGIDSFLVGALCACACKILNASLVLIMLPCFEQEDISDSNECCVAINKIYSKATIHTINLQNGFTGVLQDFKEAKLPLTNPYSVGNIQARLRMVYEYAYSTKLLLAGTDHTTESITGFYTKYGDGGCDINPIAQLVKDDIYLMSKLFTPPKSVMSKAPAAGLGISKTDEDELKISYLDICMYLKGHPIKNEVREKLEGLYDKSAHKRKMPVSLNDNKPIEITHVAIDFINAFVMGTMACKTGVAAVENAINYINNYPLQRVLYVCDNHPKGHCSFKQNGGVWNEHAVKGTQDAQVYNTFFEDVKKTVNTPIERYNIFYKGRREEEEEYSGYESWNENFGALKANCTKKVVVSGIATEYCVKNTVIDLINNGFEVTVLKNALAYIDYEEHLKTLEYLEKLGAKIAVL